MALQPIARRRALRGALFLPRSGSIGAAFAASGCATREAPFAQTNFSPSSEQSHTLAVLLPERGECLRLPFQRKTSPAARDEKPLRSDAFLLQKPAWTRGAMSISRRAGTRLITPATPTTPIQDVFMRLLEHDTAFSDEHPQSLAAASVNHAATWRVAT